MTEQSKEFERLASRIEGALAPLGATVTCPDHLVDRVTRRKREVDVSIRARVGSTDLLITVECRDRAKMEDVTWIEQLATKRDDIGANLTIAVSSSSFSSAALEKARFLRIETRIIEEITETEIVSWTQRLEAQFFETEVWRFTLSCG